MTECPKCDPGEVQPYPGQYSCVKCGDGFAANRTNNECYQCTAGTPFLLILLLLHLHPLIIMLGTFASWYEEGCITCNSGSVAPAGSKSCTSCLQGTFADVDECKKCPAGMYFSSFPPFFSFSSFF